MIDLAGIVTVQPFGVDIDVAPGERVLDAILRAGRYVPFGCNNGGCGTCVAPVLSGTIEQDPNTVTTLDSQSREDGKVLLCSARLRSERAEVDVSGSGVTESEFGGADVVEQTVAVDEIVAVAPSLTLLRLHRPDNWAAQPGQFVQVGLPDGSGWRSYSIASSTESNTVDLLIRTVSGGAFSAALQILSAGDLIRIRGPYGIFAVRTSHRPKVFVGGGAGIGPLRPMIHRALGGRDKAPVTLIHTGRSPQDLAFHDEFASLAAEVDRFTYHPSTTAQTPPEVRGAHLAIETIDRHHQAPDLRRSEAYICGPEHFVDAVAKHLTTNGLRERYLAADRFTTSRGLVDTCSSSAF